MKPLNFYIILLLGFIIIAIPFIAEASITIDVRIKDSFGLGETISFEYSITSDTSTEITFIPHIKCPTVPVPPLDQRSITLSANVPYRKTFTGGMIIEDFVEPQTCTAYVQILAPFEQRVEKQFKIATKPSFRFDILTCKDESCGEKTGIFIKDQTIYLNYESDISDPEVKATLISPDNKKQEITLPFSFTSDQIGTYALEVKSSKEGYKTISKKVQFGVIEKEADIPSISICNGNGVCDPGEDYQNCPQDCISPYALRAEEEAREAEARRNLYYLLGGIGILLVIGAAIYFFYYYRRFRRYQ